jgi:Na+-transporting NADH:ubiquinone oxidoreductase subunit NqrE
MSHRKRSRDVNEESSYSEIASQFKEIAITFKNQGLLMQMSFMKR